MLGDSLQRRIEVTTMGKIEEFEEQIRNLSPDELDRCIDASRT
jgi:hypothetical protein